MKEHWLLTALSYVAAAFIVYRLLPRKRRVKLETVKPLDGYKELEPAMDRRSVLQRNGIDPENYKPWLEPAKKTDAKAEVPKPEFSQAMYDAAFWRRRAEQLEIEAERERTVRKAVTASDIIARREEADRRVRDSYEKRYAELMRKRELEVHPLYSPSPLCAHYWIPTLGGNRVCAKCQGRNDIMLFTFNEKVEKIDPAFLRPGRCIMHHEFDKFSPAEADVWLKAHEGPPLLEKERDYRHISFTLAELYGRLRK